MPVKRITRSNGRGAWRAALAQDRAAIAAFRAEQHVKANARDTADAHARLLSEDELAENAAAYSPETGVYFLLRAGKIVYVGQSTRGKSRIHYHTRPAELKLFDSFVWLSMLAKHLNLVEAAYIDKFRPEYNVAMNFSRSRQFHSIHASELLPD